MKKFAIAAALTAVLATTAGMQAQGFRGSYNDRYSSYDRYDRHDRRNFERHERERRIREARERDHMRHHDFFAGNHYSRYR